MTFAVVQATRCAPLPVCTACVDTWAFVGGFFAAPIFLPADIFLTCTTTNIPGFSLLRVPALFLNRLCIRVSTKFLEHTHVVHMLAADYTNDAKCLNFFDHTPL